MLDDPESVLVCRQIGRREVAVPLERRESAIERKQMPPHDQGVDAARAHRPNSPAAIRRRCAASILASCGTQSQ